jgi:superfamily II DNA or RNA helicase
VEVIQLRDYQAEALEKIENAFIQHDGVFYTLPTGGGKTVVFSELFNRLIPKGYKCVMVAHRKELIKQAHRTILRLTGIDAGIIQACDSDKPDSPIQLCMIQSLRSRKLPFNPDLIVTDEAHLCKGEGYTKFYNRYPLAKRLFVSATPCRLDGKGFKDLADVLIEGLSIGEMVESSYLSTARVFTASNVSSGLKNIGKRGGDYKTEELANMMQGIEIMGDVVNQYKKHASGRKGVVFCVNVLHSIAVAKAFNDAGIKAEHIDGDSKDEERSGALERLKTGETTIITNCGILCEGWDEPSISYVGLARPTKSLALYIQQAGRGLRLFEGKENCIILDHGNNTIEHGHIEEKRQWTLKGGVKQESDWGDAVSERNTMKECLSCGEWQDIKNLECECGYQFLEISTVDVEMTEWAVKTNEEKQKIVDAYIEALKKCKQNAWAVGKAFFEVKENKELDVSLIDDALSTKERNKLISKHYSKKEWIRSQHSHLVFIGFYYRDLAPLQDKHFVCTNQAEKEYFEHYKQHILNKEKENIGEGLHRIVGEALQDTKGRTEND